MAFASVGTLGKVSDTSAGTSIVLTTAAAAEAGNIVIVVVAKDNVSTTDGNTNEITSVTDSATGNTWTKAREFCNGQGAANAGATVAVYYSRITNQIALGGTITANFSDSRTASAISAWEFSGNAISVDGTPVDLANDAAGPGSMALAGLTNASHIFFRGIAVEVGAMVGLTPTVGYTAIEFVSGGVGAAGMGCDGEFIIATATGHTSAPSGDTGDQAAVFIGFIESGSGPLSGSHLLLKGV